MDFTFEDKYDDVEAIPAQFRSLYTEAGTGLEFNSEQFAGVREAVLGLNKALRASRNEAKTYKTKASSLDLGKLAEFGETPDGILEAFQARLDEAQKAAKNDEDAQRRIEKTRAELVAQQETVVGEKDAMIQALRAQLEDTMGRQAALSALSGKALDPDLVLPFIIQQLRPVEADGRLRMIVVDSEGDPRVNPVTQQEVTISDLVEEMRDSEKYAPLFRSESRSGGGATSPGRAATASTRQRPLSEMKPVEKIAGGLRKGQARAGQGRGVIT